MDKEKLIKKAQIYLDKKSVSFDAISMDSVIFEENRKIRGGIIKSIYIISYESFLKDSSEGITNFVVLDAETEELLFIMTPNGFIEN